MGEVHHTMSLVIEEKSTTDQQSRVSASGVGMWYINPLFSPSLSLWQPLKLFIMSFPQWFFFTCSLCLWILSMPLCHHVCFVIVDPFKVVCPYLMCTPLSLTHTHRRARACIWEHRFFRELDALKPQDLDPLLASSRRGTYSSAMEQLGHRRLTLTPSIWLWMRIPHDWLGWFQCTCRTHLVHGSCFLPS